LILPPISRWLSFLRPMPAASYPSVYFGRILPNISSRQEVHHCFITLLHGEQLRDLHVSALACSPPSRFSHFFQENFRLVFPSAAVVEEMFPCLGHSPAYTTAPPALVVISVTKPFQVCTHWCMSRLQSVEPGCQRLHAVHWDGSLASHFAFQLIAVMFTAFVGLSLCLHCRLYF